MNKNLIILLALIGLIGLFSNCEKDGTQVTILENPIVPTIVSLPDLTLVRDNGLDTIEFVGTPVDLGFNASATYFLEACLQGNGFADVTTIYSGVQDTSIQMTISELNGILLKGFPQDQTSSVDFRIRATLVVDGGQGAPGTGGDLMEYISETTNDNATIYGLPRLDLFNSGVDQKIESVLGDGVYTSYVLLDATKPFTLWNPDTDIEYGAANATDLVVDGAGITVGANDWYELTADINDLKYTVAQYSIGLIGSAVPPYDWSEDINLDYDISRGVWFITIDLLDGEFKFRKNDGWAWNLGGNGTADSSDDNYDIDANSASLSQSGKNLGLPDGPGNYTITLTIIKDETGTVTVVKN